jgi:hypothetical protein
MNYFQYDSVKHFFRSDNRNYEFIQYYYINSTSHQYGRRKMGVYIQRNVWELAKGFSLLVTRTPIILI